MLCPPWGLVVIALAEADMENSTSSVVVEPAALTLEDDSRRLGNPHYANMQDNLQFRFINTKY